jgi:hypothetical protein
VKRITNLARTFRWREMLKNGTHANVWERASCRTRPNRNLATDRKHYGGSCAFIFREGSWQ